MDRPDHWPQRTLVLRTPRLELRPDDDEGLLELVEEAYRGIHPPERMPFLESWTDADPRYLGRGMLQYHWSERAAFAPEKWTLHFLARLDGRVIGTQGMTGVDFGVTREVDTGSWLGQRFQGRGLGTEMRAAVLAYAFDVLGAEHARSDAFADNHASHRVSEKLGYHRDGLRRLAVRGKVVDNTRLRLPREDFRRPAWELQVEGHTPALAALLSAPVREQPSSPRR
ncbi:MAG: GNAT family N-acetyltransferase [Pseudonocardia sp.]|nr:GNAT family N-acetyltransferase [Pseudonocardia sp.]